MELTKSQVQKIEDFLDDKGFHYIDLRFEILDHMISDIEDRMQKEMSFEEAFVMTKIRWEKHLRLKNSFYFGLQYSNFRIVIKKAAKLFRPFFFLYLGLYFTPNILLRNYAWTLPESIITNGNLFLQVLGGIVLLYVAFVALKMMKEKQKTTYSFILKTQYWGIVFIPLSVFLGNVIGTSGELNAAVMGFYCAGISVGFIVHYFYKKHLAQVYKLKIL